MSTDDDFETRLRGRLHDLADREDDWDDPAPAAREYAAAGIAPDDDPAILTPASATAPRRRPWTVLAVAAVLLAFVVGGGLGIRELARTGDNGSAASAAIDRAEPEAASAAVTPTAGEAAGSAAPGGDSSGSAGSCPVGAPTCVDTVVCNDLGPAQSSGPLAGNGSIRTGGIIGPRVAAGAATDIPVVLSFASDGPTVQLRAPRVVLVQDGRLVPTGGVTPDLVQSYAVVAGAADSGSISFQASSCDGTPLPAGGYEVAVVYPYRDATSGTAESYLVSAPLRAVVS